MNNDLKNLVDGMYELCDVIQEALDWNETVDIRDILKIELVKLVMYISASDGTISYKESKLIEDYFGFEIEPSGIRNFIIEENIYSTEFESEVPASFKIFVKFDNFMAEAGIELDNIVSESLLKLYMFIAEETAGADGYVDPLEKADLNIYLSTLDGYLTENLYSRKVGAKRGAADNTGAAVPGKTGSVPAPRKG